jgi:UDP-glucuronate 4-epimerase
VVLEAAMNFGKPRVVFASSSSVYGEREEGPFRETDRVERPISPYAATKRAGELIAHTFHHACDLSITCARIFTAYGPRQRPDLAIRKFAERMLDRKPVPVFGDGQSLRDFTYIDDLVEGLVLALDHDLGFAILNLGGGKKASVLEMIDLLQKTLGVPAQIEWVPAQVGDVRRTWADVTAAREALTFEPRVCLAEGIERFVAWLREQS